MSLARRSGKEAETERTTGLVSAFQNVTDGVIDLAKTHMELAKAEVRQDARAYGEQVIVMLGGVGLILLGIGIFNVALICLAGVFGGLAAMAGTAGALGAIEILFGFSYANRAYQRIKERDALPGTRDEIQRSREWVKQITDNS